MIISENQKPSIEEFAALMRNTDAFLNKDAIQRPDYYTNRGGSLLEKDVYKALCICAENTSFKDSISLISGASFPDIVAKSFYGVEVKSTNKNHWKSIGSSILESTRNINVEKIFLTFGKLGNPISFLSKPYEECLSGISVTHYPRYQIDMQLENGQTIFDKMGIKYDDLRKMTNPVLPVAQYYKSILKDGESLWWAQNEDIENSYSSPIIRLWTSLSNDEKNYYTIQGYALFPEILKFSCPTKYQNFALWLVSKCSIVNTNIRDQFSAGGKVNITTKNKIFFKMPAVFGRIQKYKNCIKNVIETTKESILKEYWHISIIHNDRLEQWCKIISNYAGNSEEEKSNIYQMLTAFFNE